MNLPRFLILGLACLLILASGHAATTLPPPDFSIFRPEVQKITPDDPRPILKKVFQENGHAFTRRGDLTPGPQDPRGMTALGAAGTYVFLIPPEQCHVFSYPKENAYVIGSKDYYEAKAKSGVPKLYGITFAEIDLEPFREFYRNEKNGEVTEYVDPRAVEYKLWLQNLFELPATLRWGKKAGARDQTFGLRVQTTDAAFLRLLKEKKIGLAVRVRIDDCPQATDTNSDTRRSFNPPKKSYRLAFLPATLLEAWVVDTTTQLSVVHWSASPAEAK